MGYSSSDRAPLAEVVVARCEGATTVDLTGEVDMSNAEDVLGRLRRAAVGSDSLTVDLSRLSFIDSAAIAALDRLNRELTGGPCRLGLVASSDSVAGHTLRLAGMDQILPVRSGA